MSSKHVDFVNKHRMGLSRTFIVIFCALYLFTKPLVPLTPFISESCEILAIILIFACILGRLLSITFIAGRKDVEVVSDGPFSIVRNPLYCSSFLGIVGIGLLTRRIELTLFLIISFIGYYWLVIRNEEKFLATHYPATFATYCKNTPALIPNFKQWYVPEHITIETKALLHAYRDIPWFMILYILSEILEELLKLPWFFER